MKLLVRNLARATNEEALMQLFAKHGSVLSCTLILDDATGLSKGFGFITMSKPLEAKTAMQALNFREIDGNRIRVKKAEPAKKTTVNKPEPNTESVWTKPD